MVSMPDRNIRNSAEHERPRARNYKAVEIIFPSIYNRLER